MKTQVVVLLLSLCVGLACAQWYRDAYPVESYEADDYYADAVPYGAVSPWRDGRGGGKGGFWYYYGPERGHGWGRGGGLYGGGGYGGGGHGGGYGGGGYGGGYGGGGHGGGYGGGYSQGYQIGGFGGGGWGWRRRGIPKVELVVPLWRLRGWGWRGW